MFSIFNYILLGALFLTIISLSNHAVLSKTNAREPLPYNYSLRHIYSTPDHRHFHHPYQKTNIQKRESNLLYQRIVYAPLPVRHLRLEEKQKHYTETSTSAVKEEEGICSQKEQIQKYLQPQNSLKEPNTLLQIVPKVAGYNIDFKAVNNKLNPSESHENNPNLQVNKQMNINYFKPLISYKKPVKNVMKQYPKPNSIHSILEHKFAVDRNIFKGNVPIAKEEDALQPGFFVKGSEVELKTRVSKIARAAKSSININSSFKKLPVFPEKYFNYSQN